MSSQLFVLALAFFVGSGLPKDDKAKDLDKMQGTWEVESMEFRGKEEQQPEGGAGAKKFTIVFDKDEMTFRAPFSDGSEGEKKPEFPRFRLVLDSNKSPRTVAMEVLNGPKKGEKGIGIYTFKDEQLWLCMPNGADSGPPPKEFKTGPDSKHVLMKLKRAEK